MMRMKKLLAAVLTVALSAVMLAACGSKEQTVTYQSITDSNGLIMTDTMTLDAVGDKVEKLSEVVEMDMANLDEATQALLVETYDEIVAQCNEIDGVECTTTLEGAIFTLNMVVDTTSDAVSQLVELGILQIEGDGTNGLSLKATGEALEAGGYVLVE